LCAGTFLGACADQERRLKFVNRLTPAWPRELRRLFASSLTECPFTRRVVAVCLVIASLVTLTNAALQPVNSQVFTTATNTQSQTYFTVNYTTSALPVTVFTVQFVSVTSLYTYVLVQFTTVTSYLTRTQTISITRSPVNYPPPALSGLSLSKTSIPRHTTFNACRADSTLFSWDTYHGLVESSQDRCFV